MTPRPTGIHTSSLRKSGPITRREISRRIANNSLPGITKQHTRHVVSKNNGNVSHIILLSDWQEKYPQNENEMLRWDVGVGSYNTKQDKPFDTSLFRQTPVPVFAAEKPTLGAQSNYYIGHFVADKYEKLQERLVVKGEEREAFVDFKFHHFDVALAAALR